MHKLTGTNLFMSKICMAQAETRPRNTAPQTIEVRSVCFLNFITPQAHFRKVTVHVVGKSGCVLHARAADRARAVWEALAQN